MSEVRVRFAPSPTGFVHVGSLRTALYNYLFAHHHKGQLVLRIEDTDQSRYVEGAVENLLDAMRWSGLDYDEGPQKNGSFGPYFQSQRLEIYSDHIKKLLDKNLAYPCFCSSERLESVRTEQAAQNQPIIYDGTCRNVPVSIAKERMETEPYVIRLSVPKDEETIVQDLIRGTVHFQNELIDDQVLIKSDGFPTYHFANVVDDHLMQISHVIRGEEWLPSTPKHVLLYQAFGWDIPEFAHLPLLLNADRSKLSKRQGDVAVEDYRNKGILPDALINFVAMLGWNTGDDQEIFSYQELIDSFTLERVNKAGAVFDLTKLEWMNGQYLRNIPEEAYLHQGLEWMHKFNLDVGNPELNQTILKAVRPALNKFNDLPEKSALFFSDKLDYETEALEWIQKSESKDIFQAMLPALESLEELNLDTFGQMMKNVQQSTGHKGKNLWMAVRSAITGMTHGPELPIVLNVLGKDKVLQFLKQALEQ